MMSNRFLQFPGLPQALWQFGNVVCAEFRDWTSPQPDQWVKLSEELADVLGFPKLHGNAFCGEIKKIGPLGPKASGSWKRIRRKSGELLSLPAARHSINIDSGYKYIVGESMNDGYVSFDIDTDPKFKMSKFAIVVATGIAKDPESLIQKISPVLKGKLNARWGAAYSFPRAASGNYYTMHAAFNGDEVELLGGSNIMNEHSGRVSRPRLRSPEFRYALGYVREIYEINFLSDEHLQASINGSTIQKYVETIGVLTKSTFMPALWEWRLDADELAKARSDWEDSGLVLAAKRAPITEAISNAGVIGEASRGGGDRDGG